MKSSALTEVKEGRAIDTILRDRTVIAYPDGSVTQLFGAAHQSWVAARRRTWMQRG